MSSKYFWYCNACGAQNSREDGECQFCECGGATCKRDSCSGPNHAICGWVERDHYGDVATCGDAATITVIDEDGETEFFCEAHAQEAVSEMGCRRLS